jgi:hypothetical protein
MNTAAVLSDLITTHGVDVLDHLDRDMEIPVLTGLQRQGDVIVIPDAKAVATTAVPATGTPVVRGENGGNTHAILAQGLGVLVDVRTPSTGDLRVATLTVPAGSVAWLAHPEHGYMGIGPGTYTVNRQREQADEARIVAD